MSEYQTYHFMAIDQRLTPEQMGELRKLTSRARITPTSLRNEYHFGNFKGEPLELMRQYFDAFYYFADWGTQRLMLRLPKAALDRETIETFAAGETLKFHLSGEQVIVEFEAQEEFDSGEEDFDRYEDADLYDYDDDDEDNDSGDDDYNVAIGYVVSSLLPGLTPLRNQLANGDFRALYLGWLAAAVAGEWISMRKNPRFRRGWQRSTGRSRPLRKCCSSTQR